MFRYKHVSLRNFWDATEMKADVTTSRTIVEMPKYGKRLQRDQHFVLLGSCFAQYMGERFQDNGMDAVCNPLGAAYNPKSIAIQVGQALGNPSLSNLHPSIFKYDGRWRSWWANTLLSDTDEKRFCLMIQETFARLGLALRQADFLFVTLGTNVCYRLKEKGMIVANCHKVPSRCFEEVTLDVETCTDTLCNMVELLAKECPKLQVVFTVSPYRYKKYGFHGSQLAKATLLLAVDQTCKRFAGKTSYFPAYEILLDELRDYDYYADDMIHPAPVAVDYIWHRLLASNLNCDERETQVRQFQ